MRSRELAHQPTQVQYLVLRARRERSSDLRIRNGRIRTLYGNNSLTSSFRDRSFLRPQRLLRPRRASLRPLHTLAQQCSLA